MQRGGDRGEVRAGWGKTRQGAGDCIDWLGDFSFASCISPLPALSAAAAAPLACCLLLLLVCLSISPEQALPSFPSRTRAPSLSDPQRHSTQRSLHPDWSVFSCLPLVMIGGKVRRPHRRAVSPAYCAVTPLLTHVLTLCTSLSLCQLTRSVLRPASTAFSRRRLPLSGLPRRSLATSSSTAANAGQRVHQRCRAHLRIQ